MSEDELEFINSAIALGDPVAPPVGTILRFGDEGKPENTWTVTGCGILGKDMVVHLRQHSSVGLRFRNYRPRGVRGRSVEIVWVPSASPPFEAWERASEPL